MRLFHLLLAFAVYVQAPIYAEPRTALLPSIEATTDLTVGNRDTLSLHRTYHTKNDLTGNGAGGWWMNGHLFLIAGQDPSAQTAVALAGEPDGSISTYYGTLDTEGNTCEIELADGTRRIYEKVETLPSSYLGEELNPIMAHQLEAPVYYRLTQELLPSLKSDKLCLSS